MKLPAFSEFIQAVSDGKYEPKIDYDTFTLPPNLSHDKVVEFAERTASRIIMIRLEQYHSWLDAVLTTSEQRP